MGGLLLCRNFEGDNNAKNLSFRVKKNKLTIIYYKNNIYLKDIYVKNMRLNMSKKKTQFVILGLLSEGPLTGYDIKKIIDLRFGFFWNESYGQIFPMLKQLSQDHLIELIPDVDMSSSSSKREKNYYQITEQGRMTLLNWLEEPVETETVRFEILLKMYFSNEVDSEVMKKHINAFKLRYLEKLAMLDLFSTELKPLVDLHNNHEEVLSVINFGQKVYRAYVQWSDETLEQLEKKKRGGSYETKN